MYLFEHADLCTLKGTACSTLWHNDYMTMLFIAGDNGDTVCFSDAFWSTGGPSDYSGKYSPEDDSMN